MVRQPLYIKFRPAMGLCAALALICTLMAQRPVSARADYAGSNVLVAETGTKVELKGTRWLIADVAEGSWCKSGRRKIKKGETIAVAGGQLSADFDGASLTLKGIFKVLQHAAASGEYSPTKFYDPKEKVPAVQTQVVTEKQLQDVVDVEFCGANGQGVGILQFATDWRGPYCGPVSGWKYILADEAIVVVDYDLDGKASEQDMMIYDGCRCWMPWHHVTCDTKVQYYELTITSDATLTAKTRPLGDLGEDADIAKQWNDARKIAGLPPGVFDPALSGACKKHAAYLKRNDLMAHDEDPKLPGYSEDGARAGISSNIAFDGRTDAVHRLIGTLYHRAEMLNPREPILHLGGNDYAHLFGNSNRPKGLISDLPTEKRQWNYVQLNPAPAARVDWTALEDELPRTPAASPSKELGFPIWVRLQNFRSLPPMDSVDKVKASLHSISASANGKAVEVKCYLSYPGFHVPADCSHNYGLVALIPLAPLKPGIYEARFEYEYKSTPEDVQWRFEITAEKK